MHLFLTHFDRPFFIKSVDEAFFVSFISFYHQKFYGNFLFDSPSFINTHFNVRNS